MVKDTNGVSTSQQLIVIAVIVAVAGAGISFVVNKYGYGGANAEPKLNFSTYTNEKYGFSFPYPSNWILENTERGGLVKVSVYENSLVGQPKALIQFVAGNFGYPPLENLKEEYQSSIDNAENAQLVGEFKEISVNGAPGFDFTLKQNQKAGVSRSRYLILKKENFDYRAVYFVFENYFEDYQPVLDAVLDNFSV